MSDLFNFLKSFFDREKPDKYQIPFLHEKIDIKSYPLDEVSSWESKGGFQKFSKLINSAYRDYYIMGKSNDTLQFITILESSHSNGWFLQCDKLKFTDQSFKFFAFHLSMLLKRIDYTIQVAELKSISKSHGIEMVTHYYLKPSLNTRFLNHENLINQLYGNITIEYTAFNGAPKSFKFLAKAYLDSSYSKPNEFEALLNILFEG